EVDYSTNQVYCATLPTQPGQPTLWGFNALTTNPQGGLIWSTNAGSLICRPLVNPGSSGELYVARDDGTIEKRNPLNGSVVWAYPTGSPIVRGITPLFRSPLPTVIFYTSANGALGTTMDNFPAPVPLFPPVSPGGGVTFTTVPALAPG